MFRKLFSSIDYVPVKGEIIWGHAFKGNATLGKDFKETDIIPSAC